MRRPRRKLTIDGFEMARRLYGTGKAAGHENPAETATPDRAPHTDDRRDIQDPTKRARREDL